MKRIIKKNYNCLNDTITYSSKPDYDEWGYDSYWSCNDWINWHSALKKKYGSSEANRIWINAWNKQDPFESNYNWCKYNSNFNNFLKREKITGASHVVANVITGATQSAENITDVARKTTELLNNKIVIGTTIVVIGIILYKKFN